ncbi:MAG: hypothetical protein ACI9GW_002719 [Halieaceae bacterium]
MPFYGHDYFKGIPIVHYLDNSISEWARRHDINYLASYAYTLVMK